MVSSIPPQYPLQKQCRYLDILPPVVLTNVLFSSALLQAGYKVSRSHAGPGTIKTDAPRNFIFDIVREHLKENPVRMDKIAQHSPARQLLEKAQT